MVAAKLHMYELHKQRVERYWRIASTFFRKSAFSRSRFAKGMAEYCLCCCLSICRAA